MAELLGGEAILESLRTDVSDIQWAISGIISRTGPVEVASWKFPDKQSADLNVEELLDLYSYSDDAEDNQVAHIALYELIIDRYMLQFMKYIVAHRLFSIHIYIKTYCTDILNVFMDIKKIFWISKIKINESR